ncbi:hypothetical protein [Reinekea sp.]|jgi:hypothetical protein|uniref:hypothetical protein n=1 Tax=Reinekea sp. TaxID=1970455 RepID=UPI003988B549
MKGIQKIILFLFVIGFTFPAMAQNYISGGYRIDLVTGSEHYEYYPRGYFIQGGTFVSPKIPMNIILGQVRTEVWGSAFTPVNDIYLGAEIGYDFALVSNDAEVQFKIGYLGQAPIEHSARSIADYIETITHQGHFSATYAAPVNHIVSTEARLKVTLSERRKSPTIASFWTISPIDALFVRFGLEVSTAFKSAEGFEAFGAQTEFGFRF